MHHRNDATFTAPGRTQAKRWWSAGGRSALAAASVAAVVLAGLSTAPAVAAPGDVTAAFTGSTGTVSVGGQFFAKSGGALTLTVTAPSDTQCVDVSGGFSAHGTSASGKASWTFTDTAGTGDGVKAATITATRDFNKNNNSCTGPAAGGQASYVLDNTGPVVTGALTPAPNAAGWNNTGVTVKWTATDTGAGVAAAQPFRTDVVSANGIATLTAPAQADRLGNTGAGGSLTVRIDRAAPSISASQSRNADGTTTVSFTCDDAGSQASGVASCLADGSTTSSRTVQPGVTVTGTATDKAGNTATASATAPAGDTTAPTLSGAPTTSPNGAGWYHDDVTVRWTAQDPESGIPTPPADTTITGEGEGLSSTTTVTNGAGLSTTATSSPAVRIDRTPPTTAVTGASNAWTDGNVTLSLSPTDGLSGVADTVYAVDGGAAQSGTSVVLSSEGEHTVTFHSTDNAGNVEATRTATVRIDKTAPTISHGFTPSSYREGTWTNGDVTVTFSCADQGGSTVADCTAPVDTTTEGTHSVTGTAADGAGNTATDVATVFIDKTPPVVQATANGSRNAAGWYDHDVTVTFSATDALSGVVDAPEPVVLHEGADQSAGATVHDAAGNAASAGVSHIDIDTTDPVLTASFSKGWHTGDVAVAWSCTDALSGVATGPADDTVTGEGANLSSTASCTDKAGNTATRTVAGISIDRHAPTTTASVGGTPQNGWYASDVTVELSGSDNLSGVAATYYTVDGGARQTYSAPFSVGEGRHEVLFWSIDGAGNPETVGAPLVLDVDKTAPTTTVINPISPESGWFVTSGIPVAFEAADGGSGVAATWYSIDGGTAQEYGKPFTQQLSTGAHTITYWSVDLAGNVEAHESTNVLPVSVDTDAPTITGVASPKPNQVGWNNTPVQVTFSCDDVGSGLQSGVAGCAGDTTLENDGADQSVHGDAVDVAGNHSGADVVGINIDRTRPTLTGVASDGSAAGWYRGDVTVKWVGDDALSGIDPQTQPAASTVTGEGSNLGAGPVTIADKAGNISEPASVSGLRIDRTAPVVTGAPTTRPNSDGWYKDSVTVDFTCTDPRLADGTTGSGVASCPTSALLTGDGAGQSVTSDGATDLAGNHGAGATVGGINIDGRAPSTTSNNTCTAVNGWCTGSTADVLLTATDQAGLSGVKEIHYVVDGGAEQVAGGASATASVPLSGSGAGTVRYWAVDRAGNVEQANSVALKWDNIAPTVTHTLSPAANADGWTRADTTVTFSAKDDDRGSGVASVTDPVTLTGETAGTTVSGSAADVAGNVGTDSATVRLDRTAPGITGAITGGILGHDGWYTSPVTVGFTCSDALSGLATCPDPVVLTSNGDANAATGRAVDRAGNTGSVTVSGIKIDQEKPTLTTADVNVQGGSFTLGTTPQATCTARDSVSGVASCTVVVTGGNANGVGTFGYTATATDNAGNTTVLTGSYRVVYRWDGFLQPINDTAHQVGTSTSVFKAGSTVPAKFQLKRADGTVVQAVTAPVWLTPAKGGSTSAPVDELLYAAASDSGSVYRYDATAQQYLYNWKSGTGGFYWRIGVQLDDGQTYWVNLGLR
jgi:hypothetical protein